MRCVWSMLLNNSPDLQNIRFKGLRSISSLSLVIDQSITSSMKLIDLPSALFTAHFDHEQLLMVINSKLATDGCKCQLTITTGFQLSARKQIFSTSLSSIHIVCFFMGVSFQYICKHTKQHLIYFTIWL